VRHGFSRHEAGFTRGDTAYSRIFRPYQMMKMQEQTTEEGMQPEVNPSANNSKFAFPE
jgi:hypothetical protein